jgi:hypothetical protein
MNDGARSGHEPQFGPSGTPETLGQFLKARARRASDGRLAVDVSVGVLTAAAAMIWRPTGFVVLLSAAVTLAAFGGWGIADREIAERAATNGAPIIGQSLRALRVASAIAGAVAFVALVLSALMFALGSSWKL